MTFLTPLFFVGLGAIVIPVLVTTLSRSVRPALNVYLRALRGSRPASIRSKPAPCFKMGRAEAAGVGLDAEGGAASTAAAGGKRSSAARAL